MLFFLSMFATLDGHTQVRGGELGGLTTIQEGVRNRRISSADKTGNNNDNVGPIKPEICIYNRLLLNILYVINQKYGLNL